MPDYHHGVRVLEDNTGTRPIRTIATAVVGFVATGPTADTDYFPENTAVLVTDIKAAIDMAGTTGTLPYVLDAIKDHGSPMMVIVRVAEGLDEAETTTNVIGTVTNGQRTGLQALLSAKTNLGVTPRILGAPGLDTQAVATELASIAQQLRGFAYVQAYGAETKEDAVTYRDNFGARELMVIWPEFIAWDFVNSQNHTDWAVARAIGLRAKIDNDIGWHKTLSNVPVSGVTGISKDVNFDLQSSATDAGHLNENEVTTLVNEKGFRFWGSRTTSADPLFAFENYTRTAQVLADTMAEAHLWAVDGVMSAQNVKDIIEGIRNKGRQMVSQGYLLGFDAWFDENINTTDALKSGSLTIHYNYTPVPPIEDLTLVQQISDEYIVNLTSAI